MQDKRILIFSDNNEFLKICSDTLLKHDFSVKTLSCIEKLKITLKDPVYCVLITDSVLSDSERIMIHGEIRDISPCTDIIDMNDFSREHSSHKNTGIYDHHLGPEFEKNLLEKVNKCLEYQLKRRAIEYNEFYMGIRNRIHYIANEINNPLTSVIGIAELLSIKYNERCQDYDNLMTIISSAEEIADVVNEFRNEFDQKLDNSGIWNEKREM